MDGWPFEMLDTSIQIFDSFIIACYIQGQDTICDTTLLSNAAAASMILSAKLHDSTTRLTAVSYFRQLLSKSFNANFLFKITVLVYSL